LSVLLDPRLRVAHRRGGQGGVPGPPLAAHASKAGALEHADVLRDRRQRHVESTGELGDGPLTGGQSRQDLASGRVGERPERRIELLLVNHMVNYGVAWGARQVTG
jgi:hypothetical protein